MCVQCSSLEINSDKQAMDILSRLASLNHVVRPSDGEQHQVLRAASARERARLHAGTSRVGWHVHGTHVFAIPTGVEAGNDEKPYPSVYYPPNNSSNELKASMDLFLKFIDETRTLLARWDHDLQEYRALHMQDRAQQKQGGCCGGCCVQGDCGCRCSCARCCSKTMPVAELARRSVPQAYYFVHKKKDDSSSYYYYWAWAICVLVAVFLFVAMVWAWGGTPRAGAIWDFGWEDDHVHPLPPLLHNQHDQQQGHTSGGRQQRDAQFM